MKKFWESFKNKGILLFLLAFLAFGFVFMPIQSEAAEGLTDAQVQEIIKAVAALDPAAPNCMITYDFGGGQTYTIGPELAMTLMATNADGTFVINQTTNYYELDVEKVRSLIAALDQMFPRSSSQVSFTTTSGRTKSLKNSGVNLSMKRDEEALYLMNAIMTSAVEAHAPSYGIGDTYIEVDLVTQKAYMYKAYQKIWESNIVSGNASNGHSTPAGVYSINRYKTRNTTLVGENYASYVSYWMPFIRNSIGLHDATWRRSFGGSIYKTAGSHGCVNLPLSNAKTLYSLANVGTTVVVVN